MHVIVIHVVHMQGEHTCSIYHEDYWHASVSSCLISMQSLHNYDQTIHEIGGYLSHQSSEQGYRCLYISALASVLLPSCMQDKVHNT